MTVWEK